MGMVKKPSVGMVRFDRPQSSLRVWGVYANGGAVDFVVSEEKASQRAAEVARTLGCDVEVVEFEPTARRLTLRRSA